MDTSPNCSVARRVLAGQGKVALRVEVSPGEVPDSILGRAELGPLLTGRLSLQTGHLTASGGTGYSPILIGRLTMQTGTLQLTASWVEQDTA